jgi:hypothetical protein
MALAALAQHCQQGRLECEEVEEEEMQECEDREEKEDDDPEVAGVVSD